MSGEAWLYLLAVLINAVNLFLQVFFTIMYSDLEWYVRLGCAVAIRSGFDRQRGTLTRLAVITSIQSIFATDSTPTSSLKRPSRLSDVSLLDQWLLVGVSFELAVTGIQWQEVRNRSFSLCTNDSNQGLESSKTNTSSTPPRYFESLTCTKRYLARIP